MRDRKLPCAAALVQWSKARGYVSFSVKIFAPSVTGHTKNQLAGYLATFGKYTKNVFLLFHLRKYMWTNAIKPFSASCTLK